MSPESVLRATSISQLANQLSAKLALRATVILSVLALSATLVWSTHSDLQRMDKVMSGVRHEVAGAVALGDQFQLNKVIASLLAGDVVQGARITDSSESVIVSSSNLVDKPIRVLGRIGNYGIGRLAQPDGNLVFITQTTLVGPGGETLGCLVLVENFSLGPIGAALGFVLLGALVFGWMASRVFRRFAETLTAPITELPIRLARSQAHKPQAYENSPTAPVISEIEQIFDEISSLQEKELQLQAVQYRIQESEALAKLAEQVAHDVRAPVAALNVIASDLNGISEDTRDLVQAAIQRIKEISNDLLQRSRNERGSQQPPVQELKSTLIGNLVASVIAEKRAQFKSSSGLSIDYSPDPSLGELSAKLHPGEFKRVLSNILNNAIEAVNERGKITVALREADLSRVELIVVDNGCGIPTELLPRLMQKGGTHGKKDGNGLGLYHARETVESWGGKIALTSEIRRGTQVKILFAN